MPRIIVTTNDTEVVDIIDYAWVEPDGRLDPESQGRLQSAIHNAYRKEARGDPTAPPK